MSHTGHENLKHKTVTAVLWSMLDKGGVKLLQISIYIFLARILSPDDFGVISMLSIFIAISTMFIDSGFSQALVNKNTPTQTDYSTAFYFNILVGFGCYLILFAAAPLIAAFFATPLLMPVLRITSITLVTNSLTVVQRAKLLINLDFKTQFLVNISTTVLSGAAAIWAAQNGFGVWALVVQSVGTGLLSMILFWVSGRWLPSLTFSGDSFRSLFGYGSKLLAAGIVSTIITNLYNIVIGKVYKAKELGYFATGRQIADMSAGTINEVLNAVTFPVLSSVKEDKERFISIYSRMLEMTAFIIIPSMTLLAILMESFVASVMTDKWLPAVIIIQWFCLARIFTPISAINMTILKAYGRSDLFMKVDLMKIPITIVIMLITFPISVEAVAIGAFVDSFICYFVNAYLPGKMFGFGIGAQSRLFRKIILATAIMALLTFGVIYFISNPLIRLFVGAGVGVSSYWVLSFLLRIEALHEVHVTIKNIVGKLLQRQNN